jgi:hypothetical protein
LIISLEQRFIDDIILFFLFVFTLLLMRRFLLDNRIGLQGC